MKRWTINQLKYAHEVCFPDTFLEFMRQEYNEEARFHLLDFKRVGGLLPWIFMYSRQDYENGLGDQIDRLLESLTQPYCPE